MRIAAGEADLVLGCDMVVVNDYWALSKIRAGRSRVVLNTYEAMPGTFITRPDMQFPAQQIVAAVRTALDGGAPELVDATTLATALLGDSIMSQSSTLAWQTGHYLRRPQEIAAQADPCVPAIVQLAHPGDSVIDMYNNLMISRYVRNSESVDGIIIQGGVNDLIHGGTAPGIAANMQTLVNQCRALTTPVILGQVLPCGALNGAAQTERTNLNLDLAGGGANPVT